MTEAMAHNTKSLDPKEVLKLPYHRVIVPDEDGGFSAAIDEFPGCLAMAETAAEALSMLEEVAEDWLLAAIANGQKIPSPHEEPEYSGRFVVRLPTSLHERIAKQAEREGASLNTFVITAIAQYAGEVIAVAKTAPSTQIIGPQLVTAISVQQNIIIEPSAFNPQSKVATITQIGAAPILPAYSRWGKPNG